MSLPCCQSCRDFYAAFLFYLSQSLSLILTFFLPICPNIYYHGQCRNSLSPGCHRNGLDTTTQSSVIFIQHTVRILHCHWTGRNSQGSGVQSLGFHLWRELQGIKSRGMVQAMYKKQLLEICCTFLPASLGV